MNAMKIWELPLEIMTVPLTEETAWGFQKQLKGFQW